MALGEDESIAVERSRILWIIPHDGKKERCDNIGGGAATGWMAAAGCTG